MNNNGSAEFVVYGKPMAKGRPRFGRNGSVYTPDKTVSYENLIKLSYAEQTGGTWFGDQALCATIIAYCSIPKATPKKNLPAMISGKVPPVTKPDLDNIAKTVLDALNGIAYADDSRIVTLLVMRRYTDQEPRVSVLITLYQGE